MDAVKIKWVNTNKVLRTPHRDLKNILAVMMHRFRHAREVDLDIVSMARGYYIQGLMLLS